MLKYYKFVSNNFVEKDFSLSDEALSFAKDAGYSRIYKVGGVPKVDNGYISVTHCQNRAYVAFLEKPVGIDCECLRSAPPRLSARLGTDSDKAFFAEWTLREALAKAHGLSIIKMLGDISDIARQYETKTFEDDGFIVTVAYEK